MNDIDLIIKRYFRIRRNRLARIIIKIFQNIIGIVLSFVTVASWVVIAKISTLVRLFGYLSGSSRHRT